MKNYLLICDEHGGLTRLCEGDVDQLIGDPKLGEKFRETLAVATTIQRFLPKISPVSQCALMCNKVLVGVGILRHACDTAASGITSKEVLRFQEEGLEQEERVVREDGEFEQVKLTIRKLLHYLEDIEDYETAQEVIANTQELGVKYLLLGIGKA